MRAVWTLVIAFCFNSMYVYTDGAIKSVHPARRSVFTAFAWIMIHLPMSAGLLIGGHACAGATKEELNEGQRWLLSGGLAVGYLGMYLMALLFKDEDPKGKLLLSKVSSRIRAILAAMLMWFSTCVLHQDFWQQLLWFCFLWQTRRDLMIRRCYRLLLVSVLLWCSGRWLVGWRSWLMWQSLGDD